MPCSILAQPGVSVFSAAYCSTLALLVRLVPASEFQCIKKHTEPFLSCHGEHWAWYDRRSGNSLCILEVDSVEDPLRWQGRSLSLST